MKTLRYLLRRKTDTKYDVPGDATVWTYHQSSGMTAILCAFLMAALMELVGIHFLLCLWQPWIAWIFSIASAWLVLQILAQMRTTGFRPHFADENHLALRNGMLDVASIPLNEIRLIESTSRRPKVDPSVDSVPSVSVCLPASHNVVIHLGQLNDFSLFFGQKSQSKTVLVYVDNPDDFVRQIAGTQ